MLKTLDAIQHSIYVRKKIQHGLDDVRDGRLMSQEDAEQKMAQWLGR